jgi:hypothetical protein
MGGQQGFSAASCASSTVVCADPMRPVPVVCNNELQAASGMNFSVTVPTPKGLQWLSSANPEPLRVMLPANMVRPAAGHSAGRPCAPTLCWVLGKCRQAAAQLFTLLCGWVLYLLGHSSVDA